MSADAGGEEEPDELPIEGSGVRLTRDQGCFRLLNWDVQLLEPVRDLPSFHSELLAKGWRETSRLVGLWDLASPEGHRLLAVPATGRLQLRLSYLVPVELRRETALALAQSIVT
jgi:hypothetical protein